MTNVIYEPCTGTKDHPSVELPMSLSDRLTVARQLASQGLR